MFAGPVHRRLKLVAFVLAAGLMVMAAPWRAGAAQRTQAAPTECLIVEVLVDGEDQHAVHIGEQVQEYAESRKGLKVLILDTRRKPENQQRLETICRHFKVKPKTSLIYSCGNVAIVEPRNAASLEEQLQRLMTITVYVRSGCPRCARAKEYLPQLQARFPALHLRLRDIAQDAQASRDLQELARIRGTAAVSVPVFDVCGQLIVGFDHVQTTGARLESVVKRWATKCPEASRPEKLHGTLTPNRWRWLENVALVQPFAISYLAAEDEGEGLLPLPGESSDPPIGDLPPVWGCNEGRKRKSSDPPIGDLPPVEDPSAEEEIVLPWLGRIDVHRLGLPLFTLAVGLVDGFNPCAMWVLLFLLSVLVNVHSRWKMLVIAGTFVAVSGGVYFAFMAAWLNIFLVIGMLKWIRIILAAVAIFIGVIHIKDFFAFKQGLSFSIPDSAKPGIYERVRKIVSAENLVGALVGAATLALLVNVVELLCTAGLPALYTQVLAARNLAAWQYYGYLLLYNVAYMFDDSLMVGVAVITLGRGKMQESHGRWLKLASGLVILIFGAVMLICPEWLGLAS